MSALTEEVYELRSELKRICGAVKRCAEVCRDPIERDAWEAIADMAQRGLNTPSAPIVVAPIVVPVPASKPWWRRVWSSGLS